MYKVVIERQAIKQLARVPALYNIKIEDALRKRAVNPRPNGYIKLKSRPGYRIRVGDYRVIYNIHDAVLTIYVLLTGNRKKAYE